MVTNDEKVIHQQHPKIANYQTAQPLWKFFKSYTAESFGKSNSGIFGKSISGSKLLEGSNLEGATEEVTTWEVSISPRILHKIGKPINYRNALRINLIQAG